MNKKERVEFIEKELDKRFPQTPIPLNHSDAYTLLIAVLLSARCTDERVNKITPLLFKEADNPRDMTKLEVGRIQEIIRPCGLSPQKSSAIHELSKILIEKYNGNVPSSFEELEMLPGVGHKTASVVMVQWFGVPAFPVDTHIHRLAKRWKLSSGTSVKKTEEDLKKIFLKKNWGKVHLQMIFFGRTYCTAKKHDIPQCPICSKI